MIKSLDVYLHKSYVGQITLLPQEDTLFTFDKSYSEDPERPVLSQSFMSRFGEFDPHTRTYQTRLHPFFSNLLPEGHLREYLATKNKINPEREFALIEALGKDLPGGIYIQPSHEKNASK